MHAHNPSLPRRTPGPAIDFEPSFIPGTPPGSDDGMDVFRKLWRRKTTIVVMAVTGGVLAGLISLTLTPKYAAESRVLIGVDMPNIADVPSFLQEITANQEVVQSQSYVMTSRSLAEQVADKMELDKDPEFNPTLRTPPAWRVYLQDAKAWLKNTAKALFGGDADARGSDAPGMSEEEWRQRLKDIIVSNLLSRLDVEPVQRSHVLSIVMESENPETAARLANAVAETYIEQDTIRRADVTAHATEWLDKRIAELRQKVEAAERATEDYRRKHGLLETRNDQVTAQQLTGLNTQVVMAEAQLADAEARLSQAEAARTNKQPVESLPAVLNSPLIQALLQRKVEADRQVAELSSTLGPQHPRMLEIKAQLADIKRRIASEVAKVVAALRHEVEAGRARVATLRGNLNQIEQQLGDENESSIHLHELERQAEAQRRLLVSFLDRAKEAEVQPNSNEASTVQISRAVLPYAPSYPPRAMIAVLGVVGGTLLGMVFALFRENLDQTFRTPLQVEQATNLPVLGLIPPIGRPQERGRGIPGPARQLFHQAMGSLFERLVFAPGARSQNVLMLTSATPREGKSRIVVALSRQMARNGLRTIILDCDWYRPSINQHFGQPATPGLGELLDGSAMPDDVVFQDSETGVHAIFAGDISRMTSRAERFSRLRLLITTLSRHYDMVMIDTPPVLAGPDTLALGRMADEVAFIAQWGRVPRETAVDALRRLAFNGARLRGIVLTDVDRRRYRKYAQGDVIHPYSAVHLEGAA